MIETILMRIFKLGAFLLIVNAIAIGIAWYISLRSKTKKDIIIGFVVCAVTAVISILFLCITVYAWGVGLFVIPIVIFASLLFPVFNKYCYKTIAADPPSVGLLTIWGERKREIVKEGKRFYLPFFPFYLDYLIFPVLKKSVSLPTINVWCKREDDDQAQAGTKKNQQQKIGAQMGVEIDYVWSINADGVEPINNFLASGKDQGIENQIAGIVEEEIRETAQDKTWEDFLKSKYDLSKILCEHFTEIKDPPQIVMGAPDNRGFGIKFYRFNVREIIITDKELKDAVAASPREKRQRDAEIFETGTEILQCQEIVNKAKELGQDITLEQAYTLMQRFRLIKDGKITSRHFAVDGLAQVVEGIKALVSKS